MVKIWMFLTLSVFCGVVSATPILECNSPKNDEDSIACGDPSLVAFANKLEKLEANAGALMQSEKGSTKTFWEERRRWVKEVMACSTTDCIREEYQTRFVDLSQQMASLRINAIEKKSPEICTVLVDAMSAGVLEKMTIPFRRLGYAEAIQLTKDANLSELLTMASVLEIDHNKDGVIDRFGYRTGGGTCRNCDIADVDAADEFNFGPNDPDNDEGLRWSSWGTCNSFVMVLGEPVVIDASFAKDGEVSVVYWVDHFGAKRPICRLEPTDEIRVVATNIGVPELCDAVANNSVSRVTWEAMLDDELREVNVSGVLPGKDEGDSVSIDIDQDGRDERIALVKYVSGAGCGSSHQGLVMLDTERDDAAWMQSMLNRFGGPMTKLEYPAQWANLEIFTFEGRPYVLARGDKASASVYSLHGGKQTSHCDFMLTRRHRVAEYYRLVE